VPEDHSSPWSRPEPATSHPGWPTTAPGVAYAPAAAPPPAAAPTSVLPQAGYGVPPVQVNLTAPAGPGRGLAVVAVILGAMALVVAVVALVVGGMSALGGGAGGGYGLRGTIAPAKGSAVTGPALAAEIATRVTQDGGDPEGITCPATAKVTRDVTTICHGLDWGLDTTFVVFFEDETGSYTLLEI
jgi:hypothetical protein